MSAEADRGLLAVRRVRDVRERDSLTGLQQAVAERRAAGTRVGDLRRRLTAADRAATGSTAAFLAARAGLQTLTAALRQAESAWEASRVLTESARAQWSADRARLEAIDLLLSRRAAQRRAEAARAEARQLDELAAQRWQRAQPPKQGGAR